MALPPEERFKKTCQELAVFLQGEIDLIYNKGYQTLDPNAIVIVATIISGLDAKYIINGFISNSHEICWENFNKKDEKFFVENANVIFGSLPSSKIDPFRTLFEAVDENGERILSNDARGYIWEFFFAFVKISIKYIHENRSPHNDNGKKKYRRDFFSGVDLEKHSQIWKMNLPWE